MLRKLDGPQLLQGRQPVLEQDEKNPQEDQDGQHAVELKKTVDGGVLECSPVTCLDPRLGQVIHRSRVRACLEAELGIVFLPLVGQGIKTILFDDGHPFRTRVRT